MTDSPPESSPAVRLDVRDAVATITLDRPRSLNSLDHDTRVALLTAVRSVSEDPEVRCLVLTGTGRAFCAGQDLAEHRATLVASADDAGSGDAGLPGSVEEHYNPLVTAIATMPKPVIAAVNGVAAGAGASLALACDLRILAQDAGLNLAFAGIGLSCDTGSSWTLPRLVGTARAVELMYFPRTIPAAEALELGLATRVVSADRLAEEVQQLAQRLAAGPTVAYGAIRRALQFGAGHDLAETLAFEAQLMALTGATTDHRDAVEAFVAKRPPVFRGR